MKVYLVIARSLLTRLPVNQHRWGDEPEVDQDTTCKSGHPHGNPAYNFETPWHPHCKDQLVAESLDQPAQQQLAVPPQGSSSLQTSQSNCDQWHVRCQRRQPWKRCWRAFRRLGGGQQPGAERLLLGWPGEVLVAGWCERGRWMQGGFVGLGGRAPVLGGRAQNVLLLHDFSAGGN
jgi:hypothetical protein